MDHDTAFCSAVDYESDERCVVSRCAFFQRLIYEADFDIIKDGETAQIVYDPIYSK